MKKQVFVAVVSLALVVSLVGCKKKAEEQAQAPHAPGGPGIMMPQGETKVVVPDTVKGKWDSVVISIENKIANKTSDVTIKLGSEYKVPDSTLVVKVGDYLPDFRMDGLTITSASEMPNNPAVHVKVFDGENEIFKGWLYSKFPSVHPFQHETYGLSLKEAVETKKKG